MKRGVVYALSHPAWLDETLMSAATVRRHMPDLARQLYATRDLIDWVRSTDADHFTELVTLDAPAHPTRPQGCRRKRASLQSISGCTKCLKMRQ